MNPRTLIDPLQAPRLLCELLDRIHKNGPVDPSDLEALTYLKHFHPEAFRIKEATLLYILGLFYKVDQPNDLVSLAYNGFRHSIHDDVDDYLTPVQASIRNGIRSNIYYSFSAPTSSGKSHLLRKLLLEEEGDILIVVPSRALIAEFLVKVYEITKDQNDILVLQFIDKINIRNTKRSIFIVTPERATEALKNPNNYNVSLVLYDESQISEDTNRGVNFDSLVRRLEQAYPLARKVFSHPFIENPIAQLEKHDFTEKGKASTFRQSTVGKLYLESTESGFNCFSPFIENGHHKKNKVSLEYDPIETIIKNGGSILFYASKTSIYSKQYLVAFERYISLCPKLEDEDALKIIERIRFLIGAAKGQSDLIELLESGIAIHHGSVPLAVRVLIEKFINNGHARICFSTSTLAQGVNMPFDAIWLQSLRIQGSSEEERVLSLKNIIGRAGRSKGDTKSFDYGFVVVNNSKLFSERLNSRSLISEISVVDDDSIQRPEEEQEIVDAIKNGEIDDTYNLPESRIKRISDDFDEELFAILLGMLFSGSKLISGDAYRKLPKEIREAIKAIMRYLYEASLKRELKAGESTVLSHAITMLLWHAQGKAFREVVALRYKFLTKSDERRTARKLWESEKISDEDYATIIKNTEIHYSAIPHMLPDASLVKPPPSTFGYSKFSDFSYDLLVYDTYDYLDRVIGFCLSDVYCAAFGKYHEKSNDPRAASLVNYIKYGTDDSEEIWLLRYGFSFEEIELIKEHVSSVDENQIVFHESVKDVTDEYLIDKLERYKDGT
ncbi:MAG: DEAD/DEAH box helicase [Opitutaceae bacterium]